GADRLGFLSIAFSYPWPNDANEASGASAEPRAAFLRNDLLEFNILRFFKIINNEPTGNFYQVRPFNSSCICDFGTGNSSIWSFSHFEKSLSISSLHLVSICPAVYFPSRRRW